MHKALKGLYYGDLYDLIQEEIRDKDYEKASGTIDDIDDKMREVLKGKERDMFFEFSDAWSCVCSETALNNFVKGFKLGAQVFFEVFME